MGNLTKKEIKKLLKAVREDLEVALEEEAYKKYDAGEPIAIDMKVEMGEGTPPPPIAKQGDDSNALTVCFWICYTIDGRRYCWQYCI
ncbi:MAG: hypothetical protein OEO19_17515 [Gammaproteobacteria bacterium]|nr:hypothetical protein [Gammaproteobacteria bacterium]